MGVLGAVVFILLIGLWILTKAGDVKQELRSIFRRLWR